jgi:trk system potassium uptake protein TrkH
MKYKLILPKRINRKVLTFLKNALLSLLVLYCVLLISLELFVKPSNSFYFFSNFGEIIYLGLFIIVFLLGLLSFLEYEISRERFLYRQFILDIVLAFSLVFGFFVFFNSTPKGYDDLLILVVFPTFVISIIVIFTYIDLNKVFTLNPVTVFVISVLIVIVISTGLLSLPISSSSSEPIPVIDALFVITSAVSCTGLSTIDVGKDLSLFGQIVLITTVEIGGSLIIFISISGILYGLATRNVLVRMRVASSIQDVESLRMIERSMSRAIKVILISELIGAILIFPSVYTRENDIFRAVFSSIFHSIAGLNNAGFSLYSDNLIGFKNDVIFLTVISTLMMIGNTGVIVINEVIEYFKNLFKRLYNLIFLRRSSVERFKFSLHSKLTLVFHLSLVVLGAFLLLAFESDNIFKDVKKPIINALFNSISFRTTGYNTVDFTNAKEITYIIFSIFMFIGGGSVSIAGGIKVSTFAVLFLFMVAFFRSQNSAQFSMRSIPVDVLIKSVYTFFSTFLFLILMLLLLDFSLNNKWTISKEIFELTSAFGTVGMTSGLTSKSLSALSKIILTITMFVGKIGLLSLVSILSSRVNRVDQYNYPEGKVIVG